MDLLGLEPRFDTFNSEWPIYSDQYFGPEARIASGDIRNCIVGGGTVINGAIIRHSVIRHEVTIEPDVDIEDSIIMDYSVIGRGSWIRGAIIGRYNLIEPGTVIGRDAASDRHRYHLSPSGIVVVPKGRRGQVRVY